MVLRCLFRRRKQQRPTVVTTERRTSVYYYAYEIRTEEWDDEAKGEFLVERIEMKRRRRRPSLLASLRRADSPFQISLFSPFRFSDRNE